MNFLEAIAELQNQRTSKLSASVLLLGAIATTITFLQILVVG